MADLYELLAEAYSRPSRAFQDTEAATGAVRSIDEGIRAYKQRQEDERIRERRKQTLGDLLGSDIPSNISRLPLESIKDVGPVVPLLRPEREKDPKDVSRFQQVPFNVNGRPVKFQPDIGRMFYADTDTLEPVVFGKGTGSGGNAGPVVTPRVPPTIPGAEVAKTGGLLELKNLVKVASENFSPEFTGFGDAVTTRARQFSGKGATDKAAFFTRAVNDMSDALLRARSGAHINEQEYARLRKIVPSQYTSDSDFLARLQAFDSELTNIIRSKEQAFRESGYRAPTTNLSSSGIPSFNSVEDAEASGRKGIVLIGGRRAVIE